jgi:Rv0078B-related antitoxin
MSEELHPEQIKVLRKMTPAQRLKIALEFMEEIRQLKAAALRAQHPQWAEKQIAQALREFLRHGAS